MQTIDATLLLAYNRWANALILERAAALTADQLAAPAAFPMGSLRGTLVHLMSAEWIWRSRWQRISPGAMLAEADYPTLAAIAARWASEDGALDAYAAALSDAELARTFHYTTQSGKAYSNTIGETLHHMVLHGMQHRAECAAMLTSLGQSPGDIDMIGYLRQR